MVCHITAQGENIFWERRWRRWCGFTANRFENERLLKDDNYTDVRFNPKNGALAAIHREHNFDPKRGKYEEYVTIARASRK